MEVPQHYTIGLLSFLLLSNQPSTSHADASSMFDDGDAEAQFSNPLVDYKQCSHGNKEWHICLDEEDVRFFCPTVPGFDFPQMAEMMAELHGSYLESLFGEEYQPPNTTENCFTCSDIDSDCETFVSGFLQANNISRDATFEDRNQ